MQHARLRNRQFRMLLRQQLTMEYDMAMRPILRKANAGWMIGNLCRQRRNQDH
jgi:hypothetical protein